MSASPPSRSDADQPPAGRRALIARTEEELAFAGYSARTRETYASHVRRFLESVEPLDGAPGEAELRSYVVRRLERDGWSRAYVWQCMSALKFFYRRVCPGVVDLDSLPSLRRAKKLPEVLTRREVVALLDHTSGPGRRGDRQGGGNPRPAALLRHPPAGGGNRAAVHPGASESPLDELELEGGG